MDDVCGVAAAKLGHGHVDALVVVLQVDLHVLLQLHPRAGLGGQRVLVEDATVEEVVPGQLSRVGSERHAQSHSALGTAAAPCPTASR